MLGWKQEFSATENDSKSPGVLKWRSVKPDTGLTPPAGVDSGLVPAPSWENRTGHRGPGLG